VLSLSKSQKSSRTNRWLGAVAVAALTLAGLAGLTATSAASAATDRPSGPDPTPWNVAYENHGGPNQAFSEIAAPARNDAWAIGDTSKGYTVTGSIFAHWDGKSWSPVTIKAAAGFLAGNIYASSGDNVWIFGSDRQGDDEALVFNGRSWSLRKLALALDLANSEAAVLSASDVWAESNQQCPAGAPLPCSELSHWNGSTWAFVPVSGLTESVTSAGGHVWFLTLTGAKDDIPAIDETQGSRLVRVKAPSAAMSSTPPGFAAAPNGRLWILGEPAAKNSTPRLWHWTGRKWTESVIPENLCVPNGSGYCPTNLLFDLVYDGGNGVWDGVFHWTGTRWVNTQTLSNQLTHMSIEIPNQVAVSPGSGTVWGPSWFGRNATASILGGLIIVYGRLP